MSCGAVLIAEEYDNHICRMKVIDYKIENNTLWVNDGESWYPRKLLSPKSKHPNITPDDSTEPNFTLCYVTFYRKPTIMI
jgi:hypothetical protein